MPAFIIADREAAVAGFMALNAPFIRASHNQALLLGAHFAHFFELGRETNSQRAFGTQIVQQLLGLIQRLTGDFFPAKEIPPHGRHVTFI
jgi:hypothetical protein